MKPFKSSRFFCMGLLFFFAFAPVASADSWLPPKPTTYTSESGDASLTVTPASRTQLFCTAQLFLNSTSLAPKLVWAQPLANPVAPMDALVSAEGKRVITFDNYGNLGFGQEVVVIYDEKGNLLKQYSLEDFLSTEEIQQVPRTVSSRWWRGKASIDEELGIAEVEVRFGDKVKNRTLKWVRFRLSDGELLKE